MTTEVNLSEGVLAPIGFQGLGLIDEASVIFRWALVIRTQRTLISGTRSPQA